MRTLVFGIAILAAVPAYAGQADEIAMKAATCWEMPAGIGNLSKAEFDVAFDGEGLVADATVRNLSADGSGTKVFVLSALRALQKCAPYQGATGTIRITMDTSNIPAAKGAIDPFKQ